jgi:hypothetical protein
MMISIPSSVSMRLSAGVLAVLGLAVVAARPAVAAVPEVLVGQWDVLRDQNPKPCRISLNGERSAKGTFFVSVPVACRRSMPLLAKIGRWSSPDANHLALADAAGRPVLALSADGDAFGAQGADGATYRLVYVPAVGRSVTSGDVTDLMQAKPPEVIQLAATPTPETPAFVAPKRPSKETLSERLSDLAGRYAVLRDKTHDTGCMLTLDDKTRVKGGARAALAPACRDQGIVVFDPTAWALVNGRLVLTAKAGHMTHLDKQDDGSWLKDPAEGKSLSLKKL